MRTARSPQLEVGGVEIDHQIAHHFAQAHHRQGGQGVQYDLRRRAGFQTRRTCQYFRSDVRRNHQVGPAGARDFQMRIESRAKSVRAPRALAAVNAPHTKGVRPLAAMPMTTSRWLTPRYSMAAAPAPVIVFRAFDRSPNGRLPAGNDALHPVRRHAKVGGHSAASRIPNRPLVPAPT